MATAVWSASLLRLNPASGRVSTHRCDRKSHLCLRGADRRVVHRPRANEGDEVPTPPGSLFVFGLGYTALGLVSTVLRQGWTVAGTCRDEDRASTFVEAGVRALVWRPDDGVGLGEEGLRALNSATHIVNSVPPNGDFDRDPVLADPVCLGAIRASAVEGGSLRWLGYLSSTGVYGDYGGSWVDEESPAQPVSPKAVARRSAEEEWLKLDAEHGVPVHVFRLGGIYGPGRSILDTVKAGNARQSGSQRARSARKFTSRCHVADVVGALMASMSSPRPGAVYNVVDDLPACRADSVAFAESLLGISNDTSNGYDTDSVGGGANGEVERGGSEEDGSAERSRGEKRVRNELLKEELRYQLRYPDYRAGLAAIAGGDNTPFE